MCLFLLILCPPASFIESADTRVPGPARLKHVCLCAEAPSTVYTVGVCDRGLRHGLGRAWELGRGVGVGARGLRVGWGPEQVPQNAGSQGTGVLGACF